MVEHRLEGRSALGGLDHAVGANRIAERHELAMVSVAIARGGADVFAEKLAASWSLPMPNPRRSTAFGGRRAVFAARDQILILSEPSSMLKDKEVKQELDACGYATDQTDAWARLEISGPDTLAALERICPLDLDISVFPIDGAARTLMEHIGVFVIRLSEDRFLLMSASSSAHSFLHAIKTSFDNVLY